MRVLGIDPGLTRCGLGIVDGNEPPGLELETLVTLISDRAAMNQETPRGSSASRSQKGNADLL